MIAGAGDDLQGIKRGIMELADLVAITKADGQNKTIAEGAKVTYQNALRLFTSKVPGWTPQVLTCSARENSGISELWDLILKYFDTTKRSGYFYEFRRQQAVIRMHSMIIESLKNDFYSQEDVRNLQPDIEQQLYDGKITAYKAAAFLFDKYYKR
jgi:LAO/AO transport system kinase